MYKFSSHVQFQYLLQRAGITGEALSKELNEYYQLPAWELHLTKYGKVTSVSLKPLHPKPPIKKPEVRSFRPGAPKPVVVVKRKRIFKKD
jgi:hypothetical protein